MKKLLVGLLISMFFVDIQSKSLFTGFNASDECFEAINWADIYGYLDLVMHNVAEQEKDILKGTQEPQAIADKLNELARNRRAFIERCKTAHNSNCGKVIEFLEAMIILNIERKCELDDALKAQQDFKVVAAEIEATTQAEA